MDVSFNGITNIKMAKGRNAKRCYGFFPSVSGGSGEGEQIYREYKLRFNLVNDTKKADFDEFLSAMAKADANFTTTYFPKWPNKIEIIMRRYEVLDDIVENSVYRTFNINGQDIALNKPSALGLCTKLAEITRRISKMLDISPQQKEIVELFNSSIAEDALNTIELIGTK